MGQAYKARRAEGFHVQYPDIIYLSKTNENWTLFKADIKS